MTTLQAQTLFHHIENHNAGAVLHLLQHGIINLDERDEVSFTSHVLSRLCGLLFLWHLLILL